MATIGTIITKLRAETGPHERGMRRASKSLNFFQKQAVALRGLLLTGLGFAALSRVMRSGIRDAIEFQRTMASVSTMLRGTATIQMQEFTKAVETMAIATGQATETLGKGLFDILSASVDASKAISVLRASANAAVAGLTETAVSADAITTILNAYKLSSERAIEVSDVLFATVARGKTTFGELAPNIGKVATIAASAGVSMREMGAALATMTRNGVATDQAVTALLSTITVFLKPSDDAVRIARRFGIELNTATLRAKGLVGVMAQLRARGATIEDLGKIFPKKGLVGAATLTNDLQGFRKDLLRLADATGETSAALDKMSDTGAIKFARFGQAAKKAGRDIGGVLISIAASGLDVSVNNQLDAAQQVMRAVDQLKAQEARIRQAQKAVREATGDVNRAAALREAIAAQKDLFGQAFRGFTQELTMLDQRIAKELEISVIRRQRAAETAAEVAVIEAGIKKEIAADKVRKETRSAIFESLTRQIQDFGKDPTISRLERLGASPLDLFAAKRLIGEIARKVDSVETARAGFADSNQLAAKAQIELVERLQEARSPGAQEVGAGFRGFAAQFRAANPVVVLERKQLKVAEESLSVEKQLLKRLTPTRVSGFN